MSKTAFLGAVLILGAASLVAAQDSAQTPPNANEPIPSIVKKKAEAAPTVPVVVKTSNARLEVPETDFRFGYAPQNAKIAHNYWLRNAGPDTLHLSDVRPGCGCTKAPLKKRVLAAGDSTDVEVIFSTGAYSSNTRKSASIIADVPHMVPPLTFSAFPVKNVDSLTPFTVSPPLVNLDSLKDQAMAGSLELQVKNTGTEPLTFKLISSPDDWFAINVPAGSIAPGANESIRVHMIKAVGDEAMNKSFTIEASDSAMTRYTVPIQKSLRPGSKSQSSTTH